jgi:hypothetical protein
LHITRGSVRKDGELQVLITEIIQPEDISA